MAPRYRTRWLHSTFAALKGYAIVFATGAHLLCRSSSGVPPNNGEGAKPQPPLPSHQSDLQDCDAFSAARWSRAKGLVDADARDAYKLEYDR
jgi:hypothetical protein